MKRNIFQRQDDSEIVDPVENKNEAEINTADTTKQSTPQSNENHFTDVINLVGINQVYTDHTPHNVVFKDFNLDIKDIKDRGQFITLMGKSGCGKSTLLRYISGLQVPTSGEVYIYGKKRTEKDRIPMVFQQYTSFEWKTVLENVALPLLIKGENKDGEPISLSFSSAGDTPPTSGLITKRDLIQSCINWGFHAQACYNYERMQGIGFCHAMVPIFKKLYKEGSPEMAEAMQRHTGFFNTAPQFAAMIPGLIAAMEEKRFQGATDIDEGALTAVKTSLMGPLSGIGDTVCQGILVPLLLTFFIGMAMDGNILGPILYFIIITVIVVAMCYFSYMLGYRKGSEAILALLESGLINKIIDAAKVMGCVVIGALVASFVTVNTGIVLSVNQTSFNLQTQLFDVIVPGLLPLILTLGCYKLTDKGVSSTKIMLILVAIGVIGGLTGILV